MITRRFYALITSIPAMLLLIGSLHANPASAQLVISGVIDAQLSGGIPKAIELYVVSDIADLTIYGVGSANNGGGTDGQEFTFPAGTASAGSFIYIASEGPQFQVFFGFHPDHISPAAFINGDDAIELFKNGNVIDVFGDINVDGTVTPWDYEDGWAYRVYGTGPDNSTFALGNWTFSGANALDGESTNGTATNPFPIGTYALSLPPQLVLIHEVQGSGASSPLAGQLVMVEGVVTGDFQDGDADQQSNLRGFYVQEEDADADADSTTSEGIYVFEGPTPPLDVNVGDMVRVTGTVTEFFGETQISASTVEIIIGTGSVTVTEVSLPSAGTLFVNNRYIPDLEQYEGMLVTFSDLLSVTELYNLDRFGELLLAQGGRFEQFTNNNAPDAAGLSAHLQNIASRSIMLDDGLIVQNADPIRYPDPGQPNTVGPAVAVRAGDSVVNLTGNIRYSRGSGGSGDETYRLMPTDEPVFMVDNLRPDFAPDVGGSLRVASFNVLNYFTTLDVPGSMCGPSGVHGCRGADNQDEFDRQHAKLLTALLALDADVVGLVELENNASASLQSIIDGLNSVAGAGSYSFINTGTIGTDAVKVGFIYQIASVTPFGGHAVLDSNVDPLFNDVKNRPVLAQSFQEIASADVFTAAVNHLKSKGSVCDDLGDPDIGDGQGNCNGTRTNAAIALVNWLATDPTSSDDPDILILGDLNSYMLEDPVITIEDAGYTNLLSAFLGDDAYSFLFDGQLGALDHVLGSADLSGQVSGVAVWHINADEADATDYNLNFGRNAGIFDGSIVYRVSDHDPIVVGLNLLGGDLDGDGVPNDDDECPMTAVGEVVDPNTGCSLAQLSPCEGPRGTAESWRNHGQYVSSVVHNAKHFVELSLITKAEKKEIVSAAAKSSCGRKGGKGGKGG